MARYVTGTKVSFPGVDALREKLRAYPKNIERKYLKAAINKAMKPGLAALKATTPRGPTGNLKRAIATKAISYRSGNAVGLLGYIRAGTGDSRSAAGGTVRKGKDRAFHAHFVELGTKKRKTKKSIASSFNRLGPFKIKKQSAATIAATGFTPVVTQPKYPKAFFKRAPAGQQVDLGKMPKGGKSGQPPIRTAFDRSKGAMGVAMQSAMRDALVNAAREMRWREERGMS